MNSSPLPGIAHRDGSQTTFSRGFSASQSANSTAEQSSPSEKSSTSMSSKKRRRGPNKKPASGSLTRNVVVKNGLEYSSWQYNYDVRDSNSKRGWRSVKEGVPRFKAPLIADAIKEGRPIREILNLLGKEPRGEISE